MALQSIEILNFRNIEKAALGFSAGLNLVSGENAAGKTSLLEAIYCLGRVRSFRTGVSEQAIAYAASGYRLVGRVGRDGERSQVIGIERQTRSLEVHLDGKAIRRLSDLAGRFPVQVISADTPTILNGGPRYRRQALDWALFHVEPTYRDAWQRYNRALRQRNAALQGQQPAAAIKAWDVELLDTAERLNRQRRAYFAALEPHLKAEIEKLLPASVLALRYQPGWPVNATLAETLEKALEKDRQRGHTRFGPHRADFSLLLGERSVSAHSSRGQQKAVTVGFLLAQLQLQRENGAPTGAVLLDDLASELDAAHRARILEALRELHTQVFVTAIEAGDNDAAGWPEVRRFHVEQGDIRDAL